MLPNDGTLVHAANFFLQAEDGIRAYKVTGVQTCALPISGHERVGQQADGQDLVARVGDLPRHGRPHDRRPRRAQARAGLHLGVDGRPQARRVRADAAVPRPRRRRQGEDAMSDEKDEKLANEGVEPEATEVPEPPKKRRRKKADDVEHGEVAEHAKADDSADDEPGSDADSDPDSAEPGSDPKTDKPKRRRRGSAETTTTGRRETVAAPRD